MAARVALVPSAVVTVTITDRELAARGARTTSLVVLDTRTNVARRDPNFTDRTRRKRIPVIVTLVPPATGPADTDRDVTEGREDASLGEARTTNAASIANIVWTAISVRRPTSPSGGCRNQAVTAEARIHSFGSPGGRMDISSQSGADEVLASLGLQGCPPRGHPQTTSADSCVLLPLIRLAA